MAGRCWRSCWSAPGGLTPRWSATVAPRLPRSRWKRTWRQELSGDTKVEVHRRRDTTERAMAMAPDMRQGEPVTLAVIGAGNRGRDVYAGWALRHPDAARVVDRKSTRLNSSHVKISYAVFCL